MILRVASMVLVCGGVRCPLFNITKPKRPQPVSLREFRTALLVTEMYPRARPKVVAAEKRRCVTNETYHRCADFKIKKKTMTTSNGSELVVHNRFLRVALLSAQILKDPQFTKNKTDNKRQTRGQMARSIDRQRAMERRNMEKWAATASKPEGYKTN